MYYMNWSTSFVVNFRMIQWEKYSVMLNSLICSIFFLKQECNMKGFSLTNQEVSWLLLDFVSSFSSQTQNFMAESGDFMHVKEHCTERFPLFIVCICCRTVGNKPNFRSDDYSACMV